MVKKRTTPIRTDEMQGVRGTISALQKLEGYAPQNPEFTVEALMTRDRAVTQLREQELRMVAGLRHVREERQREEQSLFQAVRSARVHAEAQFGLDSEVIQALGLDRRPQRRRRTAKSSDGTTPTAG